MLKLSSSVEGFLWFFSPDDAHLPEEYSSGLTMNYVKQFVSRSELTERAAHSLLKSQTFNGVV